MSTISAWKGEDTGIGIVAVGTVASGVLTDLASVLADTFELQVKQGDEVPLPAEGWDAHRRQYLAPAILAALQRRKSMQVPLLLGVTELDLFTPTLNFVFGQADQARGVAIVSLARLREEFYGKPPDASLFKRRMITEAVHEVGHTLGLGHCTDPGCVMHFSNTLGDTDRKGAAFCPSCHTRLQ